MKNFRKPGVFFYQPTMFVEKLGVIFFHIEVDLEKLFVVALSLAAEYIGFRYQIFDYVVVVGNLFTLFFLYTYAFQYLFYEFVFGFEYGVENLLRYMQ